MKSIAGTQLDDWGYESVETQSKIHLFEIVLDDDAVQKYDMNIFDEAYNAMEKKQDVQMALTCARRYYAGDHTENPIWEILSKKDVKVMKDITALLR